MGTNMNIFGLSFLLYFLKMSDGQGFWINYRNTDEESHQQAVKVQRIYKKLARCELAIKFLVRCRDANVFPKFTRWKNANTKDFKVKNKYRRKVLLDEIREKHNQLRKLKDEASKEEDLLYTGLTFMKRWALKHSISNTTEIEKDWSPNNRRRNLRIQSTKNRKQMEHRKIQTKRSGTSPPIN